MTVFSGQISVRLHSIRKFHVNAVTAVAKSLQSCPTLCDPIDSSPPGSPVPGILQARTLEWVAISFSNTWKWKVKVKLLSRVRLLATPWTAAYQAPVLMGFSRAPQNTTHSLEMVCWVEEGGMKTEISIFISRFLFKLIMVWYFSLLWHFVIISWRS